jgi:cytosine/adenosine deaminase-related metal-dependent hydrolase
MIASERMRSELDLVLRGGTIVTCDARDRVVHGDVLIRGDRVIAVGDVAAAAGARSVDVRGCIVMPGFVQAHVHLCQTLFRGFAEDAPLMEWLSQYIWPYEGAHTPETLYASTRLGVSELLLGGTTCALDMGTVRHTDVIFQTAEQAGIRLTAGKAMMDQGPACLKETTDQSLRASDDVASRWHGEADGRLRYAFAPRFILSCTERALIECTVLARRRGCLIHTHASENPGEIEAVRQATGKPNVRALHDLGLSGDDVVLAHCVWLEGDERRLLVETGTRVAHCPSTNLKLASGVADIPGLLAAGVRVGLGADGAPCNNRMSAFTEMRLASLLHKPRLGANAMPARDIVRMATLGGARVLGIDADVGSLEAGKKADVVVVDTNAAHMRPRGDPFTSLVFAAEARDVKHVFVDGQWLVRDKHLVRWELDEVLADAEAAIDDVLQRAGGPKRA